MDIYSYFHESLDSINVYSLDNYVKVKFISQMAISFNNYDIHKIAVSKDCISSNSH